MNVKQGVLVYNEENGRMDICFGLEEYYGGLHCGTTMEAKVGGRWIPTRIEKASDWFLVGIKTDNITGLIVRL